MSGISVPTGGGALAGIGETFQPDLHTGTGNLTLPIPLPPGRGSLTPSLALSYSSATGNGPFGLGWTLAVPRIARRTDRSVPRYDDDLDVFVLSGAEDLVAVPVGNAAPADLPTGATAVRYRPRTESSFSRIVHVTGPVDDYWDVWSREGLRSRYGTRRPPDATDAWVDEAAVRTPEGRVFSWLLSTTADTFGNRIAYRYVDDDLGGAQRYLQSVSYADYGDLADPAYAVTATIAYDPTPRPDPFSDRRPGFDLRTTLRASSISISTPGSGVGPATVVDLDYANETPASGLYGGVSLLAAIRISGHDLAGTTEQLPPLTFGYRGWDPGSRRYRPLPDLPPVPLGRGLDFIDLYGDGLPSLVELDGAARYWRNRGQGIFDLPRDLAGAPAGAVLGTPGVLLDDVDGDGRPELVVTAGQTTTVWSLTETDGRAAFARSGAPTAAPSLGDTDRQGVLDLDGDRLPDLVRAGSPAAMAVGDGDGGYGSLRRLAGSPPPLADLADPRVLTADMSGDGLTDIVEARDGAVRYWPNLGHGRFGPPVRMSDAPRFADAADHPGVGFDPRRLLLGSVTGYGTADAVYVADGTVTVWVNQSGNGFAPPVVVRGTPSVDDRSRVRLVDLDGTGVSGVLWSGIGITDGWAFLDLTGGVKPYLLTEADNHRGASTSLTWSTSTAFATADRSAGCPWPTTLPFPVHVLAASESRDYFSSTVVTTGYRYHDGYWDPADREFRGFGCVEQTDTLTPVQVAPAAAPVLTPLDPLTPRSTLPAAFDASAHGNLLRNWSFDIGTGSPTTTLTTTAEVPFGGGASAAADWGTWNNAPTTTTTELVPSTLAQGSGGSMIHVVTGGAGCGIVQTFGAADAGPARVVASAWVLVRAGTVIIGSGNGGNIAVDATVEATGEWVLVSAGNQRTPANEMVVYSGQSGPTEFYVDHAWLSASDVPAEPVGSPPVRTVTWFHLGPVGPATGSWTDVDPITRYWSEDPPLRAALDLGGLPQRLARPVQREALRGARGRVLRTETYADDGSDLATRPYEVHDTAAEVVPVLDGRAVTDPSWLAAPVVTVREVLARTSVWDRGSEPMTRLEGTGDFDDYCRPRSRVEVGVPRGRGLGDAGLPCLATATTTRYATRDDDVFLLDRVAATTRHEAVDAGSTPVLTFLDTALTGAASGDLLALELTYYDGPAFAGLDLEELGDHGLRTRSEQLVLTPDRLEAVCAPAIPGGTTTSAPPYLAVDGTPPTAVVWPADYPPAFVTSNREAPPERGTQLGYVWHDAAGAVVAGYYVPTARLSYDVHAPVAGRPPRGLPLIARDPSGGDTVNRWDAYDLLLEQTTDPLGLPTSATNDYRTLKPSQVVDANGVRTAIGYSPLGLPAWIACLGREGVVEGDTVTEPASRFDYDLTAFDDRAVGDGGPQPLSVATLRRVDHRWTVVDRENQSRTAAGLPPLTDAEVAALFGPDEPTAHPERFLRVVEYSDGLGRALQKRSQADDLLVSDVGLPPDLSAASASVAADQDGDDVAVLVSGWKTYDNKGRTAIAWEPAFSTGYGYRGADQAGLASLAAVQQHYDPRGRQTVTIGPDGSQTRVVHGRPTDLAAPGTAVPTPWETWTYDANDNAGRTHPTLDLPRADHWDTPSSTTVDALGRVVESVQRGLAADVVTRHTYDLDGRPTSVVDPLGRLAARHVYDLTGRAWASWLMDAGTKRTFLDTTGSVVEHRDDKDALSLAAYDRGHRHVLTWVADRAEQDATLREVWVYGDDPDASGLTRDEAAAANLLGRVSTAYDEAGRLSTTSYDLDGHPAAVTRSVLRADLLLAALPTAGSGSWARTAYVVDWQPGAGQTLAARAAELLDQTAYETRTSYDALARPVGTLLPDDATGARATMAFGYGRGGGLATLDVDGEPVVRALAHDAHGRRQLAHLGNGILLRYAYDSRSFRLRRVRAEHASRSGRTWRTDGPVLQDLGYADDLGGNLLTVGDRTPGSGIAPASDALDRRFGYDALDRLLTATGRESEVLPQLPWVDQPRSSDLTAVRAYVETYGYDLVGNLVQLQHATDAGGTGAYTRRLAGVDQSNRLESLSVGSTTVAYAYDLCGNVVTEATNRLFEWDHANRLATFSDQAGPQQPTVYAQYRYDANGQRVLKLVRRSSGPDEITLYLGAFERVLVGAVGGVLTAYDEIQLSDGDAHLASIRRGAVVPGDAFPDHPVRYQLSDHLASVSATLDANGGQLNREEYLPYGETSFGSFARKRYRFTGRERDDESGLSRHGARYYAPWLARWMSCDPAGHVDGPNLYSYVRGRPIRAIDTSGHFLKDVTNISPSDFKTIVSTVTSISATVARSSSASPAASAVGPAASGLGLVLLYPTMFVYYLSGDFGQQHYADQVRRANQSADWVHNGMMTEEARNNYILTGVAHFNRDTAATKTASTDRTAGQPESRNRFATINEIKPLNREGVRAGLRQGGSRVGPGKEFGLITYLPTGTTPGSPVEIFYQIFRNPLSRGQLGTEVHSERLGEVPLPKAPSPQIAGSLIEADIRELFGQVKNADLDPKGSPHANGPDVVARPRPRVDNATPTRP